MHEQNDSDRAGRGEVARAAGLLLVILGVAVGVLFAVLMKQRSERIGAMSDALELRRALAMVESQHGELVTFLGRPGTELMKLTGQHQWQGQAMTVAWNGVQRKAVVLMDRLPAAGDRQAATDADGCEITQAG